MRGRMLISYLLASSENQALYPMDFLPEIPCSFLCKDECNRVMLSICRATTKQNRTFMLWQERAPIVLLKCPTFIHLLSESGNNKGRDNAIDEEDDDTGNKTREDNKGMMAQHIFKFALNSILVISYHNLECVVAKVLMLKRKLITTIFKCSSHST